VSDEPGSALQGIRLGFPADGRRLTAASSGLSRGDRAPSSPPGVELLFRVPDPRPVVPVWVPALPLCRSDRLWGFPWRGLTRVTSDPGALSWACSPLQGLAGNLPQSGSTCGRHPFGRRRAVPPVRDPPGLSVPSAFEVVGVRCFPGFPARHVPSSGFRTLLTAFSPLVRPGLFRPGDAPGIPPSGP
jgi:hypothetical protein